MTTAAAMNITREEAAARAAALTVDAYEVSLDLTRGAEHFHTATTCLLYTSPSPRDRG